MISRSDDHSFIGASQPQPRAVDVSRGLVACPIEGASVCEIIHQLAAEVEHLKIARDTNRRIGMAMGLVMGERQIDDDQAFAVLARVSQDTNRKLRDVAEAVIRNRRSG